MSELRVAFDTWMANHDGPTESGDQTIPAATVLALRDGPEGPEILMVQRNGRGEFGHHWVFPGGRLDPEDFADDPTDVIAASIRAALREAHEEADLVIAPETLVPFAHWMPPTQMPRRFATWFFLGPAPAGIDGDVTVDGGEIVDHVWVRPADALERHRARNVELAPPTWMTLHDLAPFDTVDEAVGAFGERQPTFYLTEIVRDDHPTAVWTGDPAWGDGSTATGESRHRLIMAPDGWKLDRR